ncbi:hypothetical protein JOF56_010357 [Kibdelosporangium banguiense]|uniref:Uncharacterized protein n=1 Tax=Kibdelosporangium banguiense TaxID=1365924 RepID=A0ABS4TZY5_9PSEU|nr:MmpS family transport accessory protein [Kibdelosporangium banguiense]MBP2329972.1 hypothetical protein [Kibdelosporangium banguiense]
MQTMRAALTLAAAGVLITGCGSDKPASSSETPQAATGKHEVVYEATGSGKATISYFDGKKQQTENTQLPWSKSVKTDKTEKMEMMVVGEAKSTVSCRTTLDGQEMETKTLKSDNTQVGSAFECQAHTKIVAKDVTLEVTGTAAVDVTYEVLRKVDHTEETVAKPPWTKKLEKLAPKSQVFLSVTLQAGGKAQCRILVDGQEKDVKNVTRDSPYEMCDAVVE